MSKGGAFNIILNRNNPQDLIYDMERLSRRLNEFNVRAANIELDPNDPSYIKITNSVSPILNFLERSHNMIINASFKPHVPIAYQYSKVTAPNPKFGSRIDFLIKPFGHFWADMVLNIRLTGLRAIDPRDRVRYASMVGHKICSTVQIYFQGIKIDEYNSDYYNKYFTFELPPEKRKVWMRCMGQEEPKQGFLTADPRIDMWREYRWVGNGHQTLKQNQDELDLWIPILFWFHNPKYAFPQVIPDEQSKISVYLANPQDIIGSEDLGGGGNYVIPTIDRCDLYVNNIFIDPSIFQVYLKNLHYSLIRVNSYQQNTISDINITNLKLYNIKYLVENLHIAFRPQSNLNLSQYWNRYFYLNRQQIITPVLAQDPNSIWTGTTIAATSTTITISAPSLSIQNNFYNGYYFILTGGAGYNSLDITQNIYTVLSWDALSQTISVLGWNSQPDLSTTWEMYTPKLSSQYIEYYDEKPVVDDLELRVIDNQMRGPFPAGFWTKYTRFNLPGVPSDDLGWYIIPFNIYPLDDNPSGYLDFTQTRENYLYWSWNGEVSLANPIDIVVYSKSINFLIISNSRVSLRYT